MSQIHAPLHATAVARHGPEGWRGVLLTGPSGAGKSDLALRLMGRGWRLVSDDYCHVWRSGEHLYACAPETIAGRFEIRGLGIVGAPQRLTTRISLIVACGQTPVERLPESQRQTVAGVSLAFLSLDTRPASAAEIVIRALEDAPEASPGAALDDV